MIEVRTASLSELPELANLVSRAFVTSPDFARRDEERYTVERILGSMRSAKTLAAVDEGRLVGAVALFPPDGESDCAEFHSRASCGLLGVDPSRGGNGIAHRLMESIDASAREQGRTELAVSVTQRSPRLKSLYESFGYQSVAQHHWSLAADPSWIMVKRLS